jgi:hypothetical protein
MQDSRRLSGWVTIRRAACAAVCLGLLLCGQAWAADLVIQAPKQGNLLERTRALWAITEPIIKRDADANLGDAAYLARRPALFEAWVKLQMVQQAQSGVSPQAHDAVSSLIPRILELVDHVYGFPGDSLQQRMKTRADKDRREYLIEDIGEKMAAIK